MTDAKTINKIESTSLRSPELAPTRLPKAEVITFDSIETMFLALFGKTGLFEGLSLALREVNDCLIAAHLLFGLDRLGLWATHGETFARRIDQLEKANRTWLGLPSTAVIALTSGDLLSNLPDSSLARDALQRVKATLGLRAARHLTNETALPNGAVKSHESLLVCQAPRSRQHEDWRTLSEHTDLDDKSLNDLRSKLKSQIVRDFVDELLMALSTAIAAPDLNPAAPVASESDNLDDVVRSLDEDDDPDGIYDDLAGENVESPGQDAAAEPTNTSPSGNQSQGAAVQKKASEFSLLGWRAIDAMRAPFTRRLGVTTNWGALPLEDLATLCRKLKHTFLTGDAKTRNYVFLAYQSIQWSLPPHLALTVPLDKAAPLRYDVASGRRVWQYAKVVRKDAATETGSDVNGGQEPTLFADEDHLPCTQIELETDPDLAAHGRSQFDLRKRLAVPP